jgi:hypothetical protein
MSMIFDEQTSGRVTIARADGRYDGNFNRCEP